MTTESKKGSPAPRVQAIMDLGVIVGHEDEWTGEPGVDRTRWLLLDTVQGVDLSSFITPKMWCDIAQREGPAYVGGCCGNMSVVQDRINSIFRDGGWADSGDIIFIGEAMRDHGDEAFAKMDDEAFEVALNAWAAGKEHCNVEPDLTLDPWYLFGVVYNAVEPYLKPSRRDSPSNGGYADEESVELMTLIGSASAIEWGNLFTRDEEDEIAQHQATKKINQAKLLTAGRVVMARIEQEFEPFDGFALVDPDTRKPFSDSRGICIYATREQAQRVQDLWARWASEERARREKDPDRYENDPNFWDARKSEIVRATVTLEAGLTTY